MEAVKRLAIFFLDMEKKMQVVKVSQKRIQKCSHSIYGWFVFIVFRYIAWRKTGVVRDIILHNLSSTLNIISHAVIPLKKFTKSTKKNFNITVFSKTYEKKCVWNSFEKKNICVTRCSFVQRVYKSES